MTPEQKQRLVEYAERHYQSMSGVVPEIASRRHAEAIVPVVKNSLEQAELTLKEIDAIAVTYAPGLIGALLVGVNFAKGLSLSTGLPLVPTHHLRSHIASNYISNPDLKPPFLCLVVSGGHSHIVMVEDYTKMRIIGKAHDLIGISKKSGSHLPNLSGTEYNSFVDMFCHHFIAAFLSART